MSENIIKINQGLLEGKTQNTSGGFRFHCFQGIPYGKPPVGSLRFQDPVPAGGWDGVRDATKEGGICVQIDQDENIIGDEDCLYLNVYAPRLASTDPPLPVMVWVHGGGFYKGCGNYNLYGPDYIIEKNIVYVTLNYRFAVLGFLCANTPDVPGNAGLKDQVLALRWIKDNIKCFGGDPNNITVFGESAGAASINFLSLSPIARGLFHKVIIQSGTSLCPWSIQRDPLTYVFKLASSLGCSDSNINNVLSFLRKVPIADLTIQASKVITEEDFKKYLPTAFLPVIEEKIDNVESVLNEDPENIITSRNFLDIPTMAGYSSQEGVVMLDKIGFDLGKLDKLVEKFEYLVPLRLCLSEDEENLKIAGDKIKQFYFQEKGIISLETLQNTVDLMSDFLFRHPVDLTVKLLSKYSSAPVYYFQFSYMGNLNRHKKLLQQLNIEGATHSEECGYIFRKLLLEEETLSATDVLVRNRMVQMWTNFAKYGNPTPEITEHFPAVWRPVTAENINYIEINETIIPGINPNHDAMDFWIKLREGII